MSQPAKAPEIIVHGTAVALGAKAVLIRGPSGAGKSDLALRMIAAPSLPHMETRAELLSDDQVRVAPTARGLELRPPAAIAGKIEVRGLGILDLPHRPSAVLALVVDLVPAADVPRYPLEPLRVDIAGMTVPALRLAAFEASTPTKVLLALNALPDTLTAT